MTVKVGKHGRYAGWTRVRDAIREGESFSNSPGSFRGGPKTPTGSVWNASVRRIGSLDPKYNVSVAQADYVVWSYSTPIAWRTGGEWVVPDTRYSPTTSCHQGTAGAAVSQL